jgi:hypothetical protein
MGSRSFAFLAPLAAGAALACIVSEAALADCRAESGAGTAALVELYTSEGCSSCPPADRWLSALPQDDIARGRIVPIALHVTYWDDLGWKDPFASAQFTARQRQWMALNHGGYVYTPQVVLAGRDYPDWSQTRRFRQDVQAVNDTPARARIDLQARPAAGGLEVTAAVSVPRPEDRRHAALFLAVTEDGVSSRVSAGENGGSTLYHSHLVRTWLGPLALGEGDKSVINRTAELPADAGHGTPQASSGPGLLAFVEDLDTGHILQAVAVAACR